MASDSIIDAARDEKSRRFRTRLSHGLRVQAQQLKVESPDVIQMAVRQDYVPHRRRVDTGSGEPAQRIGIRGLRRNLWVGRPRV
jgi:hypothetical protein